MLNPLTLKGVVEGLHSPGHISGSLLDMRHARPLTRSQVNHMHFQV